MDTVVYQVTRVALVKQTTTVVTPAGWARSDVLEVAEPQFEDVGEHTSELLTIIGEPRVKQTGRFG